MLSTIVTTAVIGTKEGPVQWEVPDPNHRNRDPVPSMATPAAGPDCLCQGCVLLEEGPTSLSTGSATGSKQPPDTSWAGGPFCAGHCNIPQERHSDFSFSRGHGLAQKGTWSRVAKIWVLEPTQEFFTFNATDLKRDFISWLCLLPLYPTADLGLFRRCTLPHFWDLQPVALTAWQKL